MGNVFGIKCQRICLRYICDNTFCNKYEKKQEAAGSTRLVDTTFVTGNAFRGQGLGLRPKMYLRYICDMRRQSYTGNAFCLKSKANVIEVSMWHATAGEYGQCLLNQVLENACEVCG